MKLSEIFIIQMRTLNFGCKSEMPDLVFLVSIKPSKHCSVLYQFCHPNMSLSFQDSSARFRWCALVSSSLVIEVFCLCKVQNISKIFVDTVKDLINFYYNIEASNDYQHLKQVVHVIDQNHQKQEIIKIRTRVSKSILTKIYLRKLGYTFIYTNNFIYSIWVLEDQSF